VADAITFNFTVAAPGSIQSWVADDDYIFIGCHMHADTSCTTIVSFNPTLTKAILVAVAGMRTDVLACVTYSTSAISVSNRTVMGTRCHIANGDTVYVYGGAPCVLTFYLVPDHG
jgi:hypothetical protein